MLKIIGVLLSTFLLFGQTETLIKVLDKESQKTVKNAFIKIKNTDTKFKTDKNGLAKIPLFKDKTEIEVRHIKYKPAFFILDKYVTNKTVELSLEIFSSHSEQIIVADRRNDFVQGLLDKKISNSESLLSQVNGISMVRRGNAAWDPIIRGVGEQRINVTIDGMKILNACPGRMDPPTTYMEISQLDKMELSKNASDVTKCESCFSGSLNLVSKRPKFSKKSEFRGGTDINYHSNTNGKQINGFFEYGTENFSTRVNGSLHRYGNYDSGDGEVQNSGYDRQNVSIFSDYKFFADSKFEMSFFFNEGENIGYPGLPMDAVYDRARMGSVSYKKEKIGEKFSNFEAKFYMNKIVHLMDNHKRNPPALAETYSETETMGMSVGSRYTSGENTINFGIDGYQSIADAIRTIHKPKGDVTFKDYPDAKYDNLGFYADFLNQSFELFSIQLGLRADYSSIIARKITNNYLEFWGLSDLDEKNVMRFSSNLKIFVPINANWSTSASLTRGNRLPDITEYFGFHRPNPFEKYEFIGSIDLEKEQNWLGEYRLNYTNSDAKVEFSFFVNQIENFIEGKIIDKQKTLPTMKGVKLYENSGKARISGAEFYADYILNENFLFVLQANYLYGEHLSKQNRALARIAPFETSLGIKYSFESLWVQLDSKFVDAQTRIADYLGEEKTKSYHIFDLRAGKIFENGFSVYLGIENIFDKFYRSHLAQNGVLSPGRNTYLSLKYEF
jgi:iron complex outermembrane receptor protein